MYHKALYILFVSECKFILHLLRNAELAENSHLIFFTGQGELGTYHGNKGLGTGILCIRTKVLA